MGYGRTYTRIQATMSHANSKRKKEHLDVFLNGSAHVDGASTGLECYRFVHRALPEINLADVDVSTNLFGKQLGAPILISPMVGGIGEAARVNRNLATAAQALGLAMGVGSQRCAIDDPDAVSTYHVRDVAPDILLFANLGAVQLNYGYSVSECQRAVDMIDANGLMLHLNPLQEALQHDGNTDFSGLLSKIELVCRKLSVPVIVKEVGFGISEDVSRLLASAGVAAIDVAGAGGTSWSEAERLRASNNGITGVAAAFADWGIPTADSIIMARQGAPDSVVIASGGVYSGIDIAKAMALGADVAGMAAPLLKLAHSSTEAVVLALRNLIQELKITMFCIGAANIDELKSAPLVADSPGGGTHRSEWEGCA